MSKRKIQKLIIMSSSFCTMLLFQNCEFHTVTPAVTTAASIAIAAPGSGTIAGDAVQNFTLIQPILTDRYYMSSLFASAFGPSFASFDSTRFVLDAPNQGSPCSIYENYQQEVSGVWTPVDPMATCSTNSSSLLTAPTNPTATVTRQAILTHACSDLTTSDTTFNYALSQIGPGVPAVNSATLSAAINLFYKTQPDPSGDVLAALEASFTNPSAPTSDDWRSTLFIICSSSYWQVL